MKLAVDGATAKLANYNREITIERRGRNVLYKGTVTEIHEDLIVIGGLDQNLLTHVQDGGKDLALHFHASR